MILAKYRPEIDGLRAFAVIPVVLFHMGVEWIPGGFIGVDVFFVISGYLITSIILIEYDHRIFTFKNFWLRRVRRILPVLTVMVITTSIASVFLVYAPEVNDIGKQGFSSLLSFANIFFWLSTSSYWSSEAENSPFLHTWSLSVEEQFYLFFPLLIVLLLKLFRHRLVIFVLFFSSLSFLLFLYGSQSHQNATFYLLPTRAWELGSGCLLAIYACRSNFKLRDNKYLSTFGLLAILFACFFINDTSSVSAYFCVPVIGAVLVIGFCNKEDNLINKVLSVNPIVYVGKISYSLYMWHWPVIVLSKYLYLKEDWVISPVLLFMIIFAISIGSYHFIEKTTRNSIKIYPFIFCTFFIAVIYSSFLSISIYSEDISAYSITTWNGQLYNVNPRTEWIESSVKRRMEGITFPKVSSVESKHYANGGVKKLYGEGKPKIVVFGDSHALMWSGVLDLAAKELGESISFYAADGTPTFFNIPVKKRKGSRYFSSEEKFVFDNARLAFLEDWKPKVVVISSSWSKIKNIEETQDLIEYIGKIGSKILLIEEPPPLFFGDRNAPQFLAYIGLTPANNEQQYIPSHIKKEYYYGIQLIRKLAERYSYCVIIPIADIFLKNNKIWVLDGSDVLYIDDDHLSVNGSLKAKTRLLQTLKNHL